MTSTVENELSSSHDGKKPENRLGALGHGLAVFEMFDMDRTTVTVGEVARALNLHKSSASRIVSNLVNLGYLVPALIGNGFKLSGKLVRLGAIAGQDTDIATLATPHLLLLSEKTGETCHLGVLENNQAVTIALANGTYSVRMHSYIGKRSEASTTAMGKAMLADLTKQELDKLYPSDTLPVATEHSVKTKGELLRQLSDIRERRHAFDDEELELGLRCISVPVMGHDSRVISSVTVAGAASRLVGEKVEEYIAAATATAQQISADLGAPNYRPYAR